MKGREPGMIEIAVRPEGGRDMYRVYADGREIFHTRSRVEAEYVGVWARREIAAGAGV